MKTFLVALLCVLCASAFVGCKTSQIDTAGQVLATTAVSVDAAMKGWASYVTISGAATREQQDNVRTLYAHYQSAFSIAQSAYVALATTGDASIWTRAAAALTQSKTALLDYLNLIQSRT